MGCAILRNPMPLLILQALFSLAITTCFSFNPKLLSQASDAGGDWTAGKVTHYGPQDGDGTDGDACGFGSAVGQPPYNKMVSAATDDLYRNGSGCGTCYEIKCSKSASPSCSETPITITLADQCGGVCGTDTTHHFDLSGFAMQKLAVEGKGVDLYNAGVVEVLYRKVPCNYPGKKLGFKVDQGSNDHYFTVEIEFADGNGEIKEVVLEDSTKNTIPMIRKWGNSFSTGSVTATLATPFSLKVTDGNGKSITALGVIPANYEKSQTYMASVNFDT